MMILSRNTFYHLVKAPDFCKEIMRRFTVIALSLICFFATNVSAQRVYKTNSVLSSGSWSKIAVKEGGIYKIDVPFVGASGFNTSNISSGSIRLFGNGGNMLSEANADKPIDDLAENAIMVVDGSDGLFNGSDYFLFYATGPDKWLKDSVNKRFTHQKNLFSDSAYYFITIGGAGKRIASLQINTPPALTVNSFNERIFHELDTINLLSSGKEWLGEEFADAPSKTLSRSFSVSIPDLLLNTPATLISNCVARSINIPSRFDVRVNNQLEQQVNIPSTGAGLYDLFAQQTQQASDLLLSQESLQINYTYLPGGFNSQGWLNFFEIHARRSMILSNSGQLPFRDWNSVGNNICEFIVSNAISNTQVWDITDPLSPIRMQGNFLANEFRFVNDAARLRGYIAFDPGHAMIPVNGGRIQNQDLHNSQQTDYLIITNNLLISQAKRLASFHRQRNLKVTVIATDKIFNE